MGRCARIYLSIKDRLTTRTQTRGKRAQNGFKKYKLVGVQGPDFMQHTVFWHQYLVFGKKVSVCLNPQSISKNKERFGGAEAFCDGRAI